MKRVFRAVGRIIINLSTTTAAATTTRRAPVIHIPTGNSLLPAAASFIGLLSLPVAVVLADDEEQGLTKIEDGSVVSNIHTSKWRVFTDNARDLFFQGKLDDAERLFVGALQQAKQGFGQRDPHVASACNNLAELYRVKKAFDKAEPLYLEAISILEESYGHEDIRKPAIGIGDHPDDLHRRLALRLQFCAAADSNIIRQQVKTSLVLVGAALHNLGQFYLVEKKLDAAYACYERALKIKRRMLGENHADYAETMYHLGK
ncbi:kinesin light chain 3-like protein, partial [Tanacetum coccineum]